jgi:hypothetical protein
MEDLEEIRGVAGAFVFLQASLRSNIVDILNCETISDAEPHLKEIDALVDLMLRMVQGCAGVSQETDIGAT